MPCLAPPLNGDTHDMGSIDPTLAGMVIDSLPKPCTSENRRPSVASIVPSEL